MGVDRLTALQGEVGDSVKIIQKEVDSLKEDLREAILVALTCEQEADERTDEVMDLAHKLAVAERKIKELKDHLKRPCPTCKVLINHWDWYEEGI